MVGTRRLNPAADGGAHAPDGSDRVRVYGSVNRAVFDRIPATSVSVLDVGCGDGKLGAALKARAPCVVTGITSSEEEARLAKSALDAVLLADLDSADLTSLGHFAIIVCSHVLEHLRDPASLLKRLRPHLALGGRLLVALPNPLVWRQRLEFLAGRFRYTRGGIMDSTHLKFFDWTTAGELIEGAGYSVVDAVAEGGWPGSRFLPSRLRTAVDRWATTRGPGLFGVQFVIEARASANS
jgi:SAM-dependent methyltransferase